MKIIYYLNLLNRCGKAWEPSLTESSVLSVVKFLFFSCFFVFFVVKSFILTYYEKTIPSTTTRFINNDLLLRTDKHLRTAS